MPPFVIYCIVIRHLSHFPSLMSNFTNYDPEEVLCSRVPDLCWQIELFIWMERPHLMSGADHRLWSAEMTGWRVQWKNWSEWKETPQSHLEKMTPSVTTLKMTLTLEVTVCVHFSHFWYFCILLAFEDICMKQRSTARPNEHWILFDCRTCTVIMCKLNMIYST